MMASSLNQSSRSFECPSQSAELGNIVSVSGALAGVVLMIAGVLRDHLGFGPSLLIMKSFVTIGYILLANAQPGVSDNLLYGWALQYGSAVSMLFFYIQLARLFDLTSFLISFMMLTMALSSFVPELWKILYIDLGFSPQNMAWIFAGFMALSMIFSLIFMPWYNLESRDSFINLKDVIRQKLPFIERKKTAENKEDSASTCSFLKKFLQSIRVFLNPNFFAALCVFGSGNFIVHNVLALMTQLIEQNEIEIVAAGSTVSLVNTQFNTLKIVLSGCLTVVFGIIVTFTKRKFSQKSKGDHNLKQLVIPLFFHLIALVLCIIGIEKSDTLGGMWTLFVGFGIIQATPYFYEVNIIEICFPFESHGVGLASIELIGGLFNFLGTPILNDFEKTGNFNALRLSVWISGLVGALPIILHLPFAYEFGPKWFLNMDKRRKEKMTLEIKETVPEIN
ncbi:Oidioi.mRNA.OKI2018_I69.chr2.g4825.t1.cds [Oikopleura dioica]|uniref:Oidioi.mRNA.OKI2018_I69.chr2.g4825.t1.cds n=1 Tax=Oikopleura dioica TaxID=34765 RepID=A0ABN7T473_OIKDI|nr:Oidioi.mRNA.OKI2018_I69.chr2.g4825.t1.cds [Oikopleura dioica]